MTKIMIQWCCNLG